MQDPQCLYAVNPGKDCHLSSGLSPQAIDLANTEFLRSTTTSYWMDDAAKRGSFCTICNCIESDNHIDCSSMNLTILPKTFDETWEPHTLDLRDNPSLVMLGDNTFESIASSLHSIYLPNEMKFISPNAFRGVRESVSVEYEDSSQSGLLNVISNQLSHLEMYVVLNNLIVLVLASCLFASLMWTSQGSIVFTCHLFSTSI